MWAFPVDLTIDTANAELVPATSRWYFVLEPRYPWGLIDVYPSKRGGIKQTFAHQDFNDEGDINDPWRTGDICVRSPAGALERAGADPDPKGEPARLSWYVDRAVEWLERASRGELTRAGDHFELPRWNVTPKVVVGFCEDGDSFRKWQECGETFGTVELVSLGNPSPYAVRQFLDEREREVFAPRWGRSIRDAERVRQGAWLRVGSPPIVQPFAAPMCWGDLFKIMDTQGIAQSVVAAALKPLRDGRSHMLLIGFPIPRRFGEDPALMHWQPLMLPELSYNTKPRNGFRANSKGHWLGDLTSALATKKKILWVVGRNWHQGEIGTRGQLSEPLRSKMVLLIGAGAVGSLLAELLVRGGLHNLIVVDDDLTLAGNLVRHTLCLSDIGQSKAEQLAARLNGISPHANVRAIVGDYPRLSRDEMEECITCDLVIDCSGSDDVLQGLSEEQRATAIDYFSVGMGRGAKRLYLYSATGTAFPFVNFRDSISPWLERDHAEVADTEFPWEGIGCWHPVFPATSDRVALFAAAAVRELDARFQAHRLDAALSVLETSNESAFLNRTSLNA